MAESRSRVPACGATLAKAVTNDAQTAFRQLQPLIVSAPFGNYVQPEGATPTLGTFTAAARPGRVRQVLRTVRYYRRLRAWVNRIGLRNPGIEWLAEAVSSGRVDVADKIVSIHGFTADDWWRLLERTEKLRPLAIELNLSCPNVGEVNWPEELFANAVATGVSVIAKLPPVHYEGLFAEARVAGVVTFHCCNTLPVPAGGLSGAPLKPVALHCIRSLRATFDEKDRHDISIIGGGGIRTAADIDDYADAGASRVAVGTGVINPIFLVTDAPLRSLLTRARERFGETPAEAHEPGARTPDGSTALAAPGKDDRSRAIE